MDEKADKSRLNWLQWGKWKQQIKDKDLKRWFRRDNLIILVLSGILLFIIAIPMGTSKKNSSDTAEKSQIGLPQEADESRESGEDVTRDLSEAEYAQALEQRLTQALSQVAGVGRVQVMITLKSSRELVVEREAAVSRQTTNETDSQGGSRMISQVETDDCVVYRSVGSDSEPYVIKTMLPEIEGVLVVAEGAGSGTVKRNVTAIVQALFDVEAHKVSVVKMETK